MRKHCLIALLFLSLALSLCSCGKESSKSSFSIQFIDVGQGDSALVECDGHYMLIDGGETTAGDKVYNVLEKEKIHELDILVISHLHKDHYGGLTKALTYASSIGVAISNATYVDNDSFRQFEHQLSINETKLTIPEIGTKYELGSAIVEVIDVCAEKENDSLVLLITYGDTKFLFTGDIEESAQTRISDKYENETDTEYKIDLIKMPHHGAYTGTLYRFLRTFMPEYAVISVGANKYGHPDNRTLDELDKLENQGTKIKVYRTDTKGDIIVKSNGKEIFVEE